MEREHEGVIKFELDYEPAPALSAATLAPLNGWRHLLFRLRLIGQDPERYGGLGFGNLSQRLAPRDDVTAAAGFIISGTQTGGLPHLQPEHYACVLACDPRHNHVTARGPVKPSSECLTHGVLYQLDAGIHAVLHVHSPDIWRLSAELLLPTTNSSVAYGTPEMAQEVQRIYPSAQPGGVFCMGGHEDGVVAFGDTVQQAGQRLTAVLAQAFARLSD
ncbi:MAG: class II aldolase/adducin family protein [Thiogranum sp.]|nr:class II aldolase/adducin family protein [Thiogranum sp.]